MVYKYDCRSGLMFWNPHQIVYGLVRKLGLGSALACKQYVSPLRSVCRDVTRPSPRTTAILELILRDHL